MGYDLISKNKKAKIQEMKYGIFSWPMILQETGMGYILGYGLGMRPGSYVYQPRGKGGSPVSNDGFLVSATEAKAMARCARGFISVKRFINKEWEELSPEDLASRVSCRNEDGTFLYKQKYHEDVLTKLEKFAEFAEQSGGFRIR